MQQPLYDEPQELKEFKRRRSSLQRRAIRFRSSAPHSLLLVIISYAATILLTRLYLNLTGFPAIYTEGLHIRHNLWGALFMAIGGVMALLFGGEAILPMIALLLGVGLGLFMDEIGEFLTVNLNYFWPGSYTLMYAAFLILVAIYIITRQRAVATDIQVRDALERTRDYYRALSDEEVDAAEVEIRDALAHVDERVDPEDAAIWRAYLSHHLAYLQEARRLAPPPIVIWQQSWWRRPLRQILAVKLWVRIAAIIALADGVISIITLISDVLNRPTIVDFSSTIEIGNETLSWSPISFAYAILKVVIAFGLWNYKAWSWFWSVGTALFTLIVLAPGGFWQAGFSTLLSVIINGFWVICLVQPNILSAFGVHPWIERLERQSARLAALRKRLRQHRR